MSNSIQTSNPTLSWSSKCSLLNYVCTILILTANYLVTYVASTTPSSLLRCLGCPIHPHTGPSLYNTAWAHSHLWMKHSTPTNQNTGPPNIITFSALWAQLFKRFLLAQAVAIAVGRHSGGRLARTEVATISVDFFQFFSPPSSTFLIEGMIK